MLPYVLVYGHSRDELMASRPAPHGRTTRDRAAKDNIDRVKSHLAKYYEKMGDTAPWER